MQQPSTRSRSDHVILARLLWSLINKYNQAAPPRPAGRRVVESLPAGRGGAA